MRKILGFIALIGIFIFTGCSSSSTDSSVFSLTANPGVMVSMNSDSPALNDATDKINIDFSEQLDQTTVSGEVKLFKRGDGGTYEEVACAVAPDANNPRGSWSRRSPARN